MTHDDHIDRHRGWIAALLVALEVNQQSHAALLLAQR